MANLYTLSQLLPIEFISANLTASFTYNYSQIFLSWHFGAESQTCHVTLIVPHVMNKYF